MANRLYLDDIRPCPSGYVLTRDYHECIFLLEHGKFDLVSLDYQLGGMYSGYDVLLWLNDHREHLPKQLKVHSTYAYGVKVMTDYIRTHFPEVELLPYTERTLF